LAGEGLGAAAGLQDLEAQAVFARLEAGPAGVDLLDLGPRTDMRISSSLALKAFWSALNALAAAPIRRMVSFWITSGLAFMGLPSASWVF
jgi:hypothetical protein